VNEPDRRQSSQAFHQSPFLLGVVDFGGTLKVVNASWERVLGYPANEMVGRPLAKFVDGGDRAVVLKLLNPRILESDPAPIELAIRCKNGSYRAFLWERRRVAAEPSMFITGKDITEKKRIEVTDSLRLYDLYAQARKGKATGDTG
jgi:PAS domain S-box-containing protein